MAAQAMRGQFRGNGWFFYLMLLGIMAPASWWASASPS
jgi:putative spermidine/putrescine transport system permease protein